MNLLIITGNLGGDAEQRFTTGGDSIVTFNVPAKSGFGDKAKTTWVRCSMWGKRGESVLPYLKKGSLVGVSGEFHMNEWTDKEGNKRASPECRVNDLTLLGSKSKSTDSEPSKPQSKTQPSGFDDMDDDIPF